MTFLAKSCLLVGLGIAGLVILGRSQRGGIQKGHGAFIEYFELLPPPPPAPPKAPPPLTGLTFAVKDIFDVKGFVTGFGTPEWVQTHEAATETAPAVEIIVRAGAKCVGKTHMDEMAFSIFGENKHYGTPVNPAAPKRVPGGSSSGSAVAVAAGLVDFALGSDTYGSVRVPAAFCGILGFRPSHGVITTSGAVPMAQSFDTVGWFARDPTMLRQVGHVLLQLPYMDVRQPRRILVAEDCFKLSVLPQEQSGGAVIRSIQKLLGRQVLEKVYLGEVLERTVPSLRTFRDVVKISGSGLEVLRDAMNLLQMIEFKGNHEVWVNATKPHLATAIEGRVKRALNTSSDLQPLLQKIKNECRDAMSDLLKNDAVLLLPTAHGLAPLLKPKDADEFRSKTFCLTCIAGMSGCCQVNIPAGVVDGAPVGVSLMAKHGADRFLLDTVSFLYATVQEEVETVLSSSRGAPVASGKTVAAEAAKEKGNVAFKSRDYAKAVSYYTEAIRLDGQNATYFNNRALAYLQMCSFQQAEADCTKAISRNKKNVKAWLRRGTAREFQGYYRDAFEDFRQALVLEPTNRQAVEAVTRLKNLLME